MVTTVPPGDFSSFQNHQDAIAYSQSVGTTSESKHYKKNLYILVL